MLTLDTSEYHVTVILQHIDKILRDVVTTSTTQFDGRLIVEVRYILLTRYS